MVWNEESNEDLSRSDQSDIKWVNHLMIEFLTNNTILLFFILFSFIHSLTDKWKPNELWVELQIKLFLEFWALVDWEFRYLMHSSIGYNSILFQSIVM